MNLKIDNDLTIADREESNSSDDLSQGDDENESDTKIIQMF